MITQQGLSFVAEPDFETKTTYFASITASDGVNISTQDIIVNVTNINDNYPEILTSFFNEFEENQTEIGQLGAIDEDNDELTYEILASDFSISSSGLVSSNINPDCETTADDGSSISWIYEFSRIFRVSDGENYTDKKVFFNIILMIMPLQYLLFATVS